MPFDPETVQKFINSPPSHLVAGATLGGLVWKIAEKVDGLLQDPAKLAIADWLLGVKTEKRAKVWQDLVVSAFDGVFGKKQLTRKCFAASLSLAAILSVFGVIMMAHYGWLGRSGIVTGLELVVLLSIPVYGTVWAMREGVVRMVASPSAIKVLGNYVLAWCIATVFGGWFVLFPPLNPFWSVHPQVNAVAQPSVPLVGFIVFELWLYFGIPSVLLLYFVSAQTLKAARRFDLGFQWYSQKFDIKNKPLQCIGLVAGVFIALLYWGIVVVWQFF